MVVLHQSSAFWLLLLFHPGLFGIGLYGRLFMLISESLCSRWCLRPHVIGRVIAVPRLRLLRIDLSSTLLKRSHTFGLIETFAFACWFDQEERGLVTGAGWRGIAKEN